ncbi:hypothetical protein Cgig2_009303 [Carnegiea gigantea]|uniref:Uncharacterized protein n=1 Tax=Carnegiea gigantea TaxID=171969 RepID=A0A9Q1Q8N5_9CARY|nr:hypothetical protein Cgig2_009303 [Carnegiea gigantea]
MEKSIKHLLGMLFLFLLFSAGESTKGQPVPPSGPSRGHDRPSTPFTPHNIKHHKINDPPYVPFNARASYDIEWDVPTGPNPGGNESPPLAKDTAYETQGRSVPPSGPSRRIPYTPFTPYKIEHHKIDDPLYVPFNARTSYGIERGVPTGPNALHNQTPPPAKDASHETQRRVVPPSGPSTEEPPPTPYYRPHKTDHYYIDPPLSPYSHPSYETNRLVPTGPDPMEPPPTPDSHASYYEVNRRVPRGPDPIESPPTSDSHASYYEVNRRVPRGPDPIESPPTSDSHLSYYEPPSTMEKSIKNLLGMLFLCLLFLAGESTKGQPVPPSGPSRGHDRPSTPFTPHRIKHHKIDDPPYVPFNARASYDIEWDVPTGPNPRGNKIPPPAKDAAYETQGRSVPPSGPSRRIPSTPFTPYKIEHHKIDDLLYVPFNVRTSYEVNRRVPRGPDPIESPPTSDSHASYYEVNRRVPRGPDPIESPPTSDSHASYYEVNRRVPRGPDPIESPPTSDSHASYYEVNRRVPRGPDPIESPPARTKWYK